MSNFSGSVNLSEFDSPIVQFVVDYMYKRITKVMIENEDRIPHYAKIFQLADYIRFHHLINELDTAFLEFPLNLNVLCLIDISHHHLKRTFEKCLRTYQISIRDGDTCPSVYKIIPVGVLEAFISDDRLSLDENRLWSFVRSYLRQNLSCKPSVTTPFKSLLRCIRYSLLNDRNRKSYQKLVESELRGQLTEFVDDTESKVRTDEFVMVVSQYELSYVRLRLFSLSYGMFDPWVMRVDWNDFEDTRVVVGHSRVGFVRQSCGSSNENMLMARVYSTMTKYSQSVPLLSDKMWAAHTAGMGKFFNYQSSPGNDQVLLDSSGSLWLFGGAILDLSTGDTAASSTVYCYTVAGTGNGHWCELTGVKLHKPCWNFGVVEDNKGGVYVVGGRDHSGPVSDFYRLDLQSGAVEQYPPLPRHLTDIRLLLQNDSLAVYCTSVGPAFLFDFGRSEWRVIEDVNSLLNCCRGIRDNTLLFCEAVEDSNMSRKYWLRETVKSDVGQSVPENLEETEAVADDLKELSDNIGRFLKIISMEYGVFLVD